MTSAGAEGGATTGEQGAPPGAPVSVARGTAWGLAADVVTVVSGLALSVLIARYLGPTNRGVYFLVVLVATLAALAGDLGLSTSGLVFATKRTLSLSHLHGGSVLASLGIAAVLAAAVLALGSWLIDSVLKGVSHGQLWLAVAGTAPLVYAQVTGSILTGLGRIPSLSVIRIATGVATPLITLAILWATGGDTTWALLAWLITSVLLTVAIGVEGVRQLGWPRAPGPAEWRRMFGFGLRAHIGTLSHHGFLRIDVLFVSARSGPRNVGLYSLASLLAERIAIVGSAVYAAGASHVGSRERDAASELTARMLRILLLVLVPAAAILAAVAHPLITILFGSDFAPAVTPFLLLLPGTVSLTLWSVVSLYIVAALERPGVTTVIQLNALLVALPAYYFAVRWDAMIGAALASSAVYTAVLIAGLVVFLRSASFGVRGLIPGREDVATLRELTAGALRRLPGASHA